MLTSEKNYAAIAGSGALIGLALAADSVVRAGMVGTLGGMKRRAGGAVAYKNSEVVKGDLRNGSDVTCGGDLWVKGVIEDCKVSVKGDLFCEYGFVGSGRGVIEAAGSVNVGHVKNQTIISLGGVNIARDAVNSSVTARRSVTACSVVGGTLCAGKSIAVKTAGSVNGVRTVLQINPDADSINELVKSEAAIKQHEANIKKLVQTLNALPQAQRNDKAFVRKLKNAIITVKYQISTLEARAREITAAMDKFENSFIHIEQSVYPGTVVRFGQRNMTLADTLTGGKTLRIVNSQIRVF